MTKQMEKMARQMEEQHMELQKLRGQVQQQAQQASALPAASDMGDFASAW